MSLWQTVHIAIFQAVKLKDINEIVLIRDFFKITFNTLQ